MTINMSNFATSSMGEFQLLNVAGGRAKTVGVKVATYLTRAFDDDRSSLIRSQ